MEALIAFMLIIGFLEGKQWVQWMKTGKPPKIRDFRTYHWIGSAFKDSRVRNRTLEITLVVVAGVIFVDCILLLVQDGFSSSSFAEEVKKVLPQGALLFALLLLWKGWRKEGKKIEKKKKKKKKRYGGKY